jgi:hypothetical protein
MYQNRFRILKYVDHSIKSRHQNKTTNGIWLSSHPGLLETKALSVVKDGHHNSNEDYDDYHNCKHARKCRPMFIFVLPFEVILFVFVLVLDCNP